MFNARAMNELVARPQSDRIVIRNGAASCTLPDYEELEFVAAAKPHPRLAPPPLAGAVAAE